MSQKPKAKLRVQKKSEDAHISEPDKKEKDKAYKAELRALQIQLTRLQKAVITARRKVLVILEGRDAAGKDGVIKRITEHLSPRDTRVVALGKPTERENHSWYFQRWVAQLPACGEIVLFNRSWYNRVGVEKVMGFCTEDEYQDFFHITPAFEQVLHKSGIEVVKYYLDISKDEQAKRLQERRDDPLSQWKISPIDASAQDHWDAYSLARNKMIVNTHIDTAPWVIIRADHKKKARLNLIRDLLHRLSPKTGKKDDFVTCNEPDPDIAFSFTTLEALENGGKD